LVNPARRVPALYLIVAAIAIRFITDIVYSIQILHDGYTEGTVLDIGWIVAFACFAAGALHPSMPAIGAGAVRYVKGDGRVRLVIIGVAGVTIPIVVSLASVTRGQLDLWEPLAVAVLDTLVVMRVARLFRRRVRAEASLSHQALHDALTGLPNRVLFLDRAELALTRSTRNGTTSALLFLDLDRFKVVNDSMGHRTGDQLLVDVAARLSGCARAGDTVARFGGDEFAILCENLTDERAAMTMAARVVAALEPSFAIETESVVMTASIGVAISRPGCTADDLLRDADAAMYRAKDNGRDRFEMFDDAMRALAVERMTIEQELRLAITREEIVVYYQPAVQLTSGDTVGFEALVRWVHPTRGLLFPGEFLEVAEETGIIHALGDIVIEQVVKDLASPERAPGLVGRWVAVNVSVRQLTDGDLVASIASALARHDVLSSRLCIEITEHALARDPARASATLEGLGALGVQIAVDDFGTGYSSLTYLQRYPVDVLKIDQSFVDNVGTDPDDTAIVNAVITLGHSLGLVVLAEGVERSDQARALRAAGCDLAQGFLYGGAVPVHHLPVREFVSGPLAS
jgi:diguanylate cyclase (GGDEF)-like protein